MQIENWSTRHPTKKLKPLVDFVRGRTKHHKKTSLVLIDHQDRALTSGAAWKKAPVLPVIQLYLSTGTASYPRRTRHVKEVGYVVLSSWEEEVLLVLAHEARHIDQFVEESFTDIQKAEVDAEKFAVAVLEEYRSSRG